MAAQLDLFAPKTSQPLAADAKFQSLRRLELGDGAWLDHVPGWISGAEQLFANLHARAPWRLEERQMYEKLVAVPRMIAPLRADETPGLDPIVETIRALLQQRYASEFPRTSAALYRDGNDSVAWHGDTIARRMERALVATISLGGERRFFIRKTGGGESTKLVLPSGDLVVMGGTCQRTHQHSVPKLSSGKAAEPRIALMYRPIWREEDQVY